jgi:hypothetical protein
MLRSFFLSSLRLNEAHASAFPQPRHANRGTAARCGSALAGNGPANRVKDRRNCAPGRPLEKSRHATRENDLPDAHS